MALPVAIRSSGRTAVPAFSRSQIRTVLSAPLLTSRFPSLENSIDGIRPWCPLSVSSAVLFGFSLRGSTQILIIPSLSAVANLAPSSENEIEEAGDACAPPCWAIWLPVSASKTPIIPDSARPRAINFPSGLIAEACSVPPPNPAMSTASGATAFVATFSRKVENCWPILECPTTATVSPSADNARLLMRSNFRSKEAINPPLAVFNHRILSSTITSRLPSREKISMYLWL